MWRTKASLRKTFFAWPAALSKILTLGNLRKWQVVVVDRCCMRKRYGESVDHLLLYCDMAYAIWIAFFSCGGLSWVMPRHVVDLYACWWTFGRPQSVVA